MQMEKPSYFGLCTKQYTEDRMEPTLMFKVNSNQITKICHTTNLYDNHTTVFII